MFRKTSQKILGVLILIAVLQLSMFGLTLHHLKAQKNDGLIINLAGRQRMLSQKMTKECLGYLRDGSEEKRALLEGTVKVFDSTLDALYGGGDAPEDLAMTRFVTVPPAQTKEISDQLARVKTLWGSFKQNILRATLENDGDALGYVLENNTRLLSEMNKAVGLMQKHAEAKVSGLVLNQVLGLVILMVVIVSTTVYFSRTLGRRLGNLVSFSDTVARGILTKRLDVEGDDDLGVLERSFNNQVEQLHRMITTISQITASLSDSSRELTASSDEMTSLAIEMNRQANAVAAAAEQVSANVGTVASAADESSSAVSNIAAMTEEMSSTFMNIAGLARNAAEKVSLMARQGMEMSNGITGVAAAVEEMSASFSEVAKNTAKASKISQNVNRSTDEITRKMEALDSASQQIGKVVNVIKDIADQTNMLALNATIEAASAGEAGKGFAVVAGEVKALAQQSAEATNEIAGQVEHIQTSTREAVKAISEISGVIGEVANINQTIAASVEEQTATTNEISRSVSTSAKLAKGVAENSSEVSELVEDIARSTDEASKAASEVARNVEQTAGNMKEIADSSGEAAGSVQEITRNIHEISAASDKTVEGGHRTDSHAKELARMASSLMDIIDEFTV